MGFQSQGCGESNKYLPRSKWKPQNPDIIYRVTDPGEQMGSRGQRQVHKQDLPSTQANTGLQTQPPGPSAVQLLPGNTKPAGGGGVGSMVEELLFPLSILASLPLPSPHQYRVTPTIQQMTICHPRPI